MALPTRETNEPRRLLSPGERGFVSSMGLGPMAVASTTPIPGNSRSASRRGFTLVEVLIVVTIIAILAGAVLPAFVDSSDDARDATLKHNLQAVRHQIQLFRAQHKGNWPGHAGVPAFIHMLGYSNEDGGFGMSKSASHPLGPYLPSQGLVNPFNGGTAWKNSSNPSGEVPDEAMKSAGVVVGWFYDSNTGRIAPNAEGSTSDGTPRVQL